MSQKPNHGHNNGNKASYPGRPHKCDIVPGTKACKKCRTKGGMYCVNCVAWTIACKK